MAKAIQQRQVWVVELPPTAGHEAAGRRPAIVIQSDVINRSGWQTVVVVPLTTNLARSAMPGAVVFARGEAGLPERSVAMCLWTVAIDRTRFDKSHGTISRSRFQELIIAMANAFAVTE